MIEEARDMKVHILFPDISEERKSKTSKEQRLAVEYGL
jgi:hypothetical protein